MLLGKRPRPPMKRTTSMTEFAMDLEVDEPQPSDHPADWLQSSHVAPAGILSPRNSYSNRRTSADFMAIEPAPFLKACGLCSRRLSPGRDIFMYRGEVAFCSLECRQQQINLDEMKEKCLLQSIKSEAAPTAATSEASAGGETVAAA